MKKILIIGAGFLQDFVIRKAKEEGYYVLVVDGDPNAIGFQHADKHAIIDIVDEKACFEYAKSEKIDGVITAATDFGVLTAAYIAENMGLPGNSYDVAKIIKNKYFTKRCLYDAGADDTDQTFLIKDGEDIDQLKGKVSFPVMVKPCDGSGSRGANKVMLPDQFEKAVKIAIENSISRAAYIESFVEGREYGIESIVVDGEVYVLGVMKKLMTPPPYYSELGHAIPSMLNENLEKKVVECAKTAIRAIGITSGSVNMDAIITDKGKVYIIDIGARMGGNLIGPYIIPYGTGYDYVSAMLKTAVGDKVDIVQKEKSAVATRLLAFNKGHIDRIPDISNIEKIFDVEIFHHMRDGMDVNEYHSNGDGLGYVVAKADTFEKATKKANDTYQYLKKVLF